MLTIIAGVPAVGKSTYAVGKQCIEFDNWVASAYDASLSEAMKCYRKNYPKSNDAYLAYVVNSYKNGIEYLIDTFTYRSDRKIALDFFKSNGIKTISLTYFVASLNTVLERNQRRKCRLADDIVAELWINQEFPNADEGFDNLKIVCTD